MADTIKKGTLIVHRDHKLGGGGNRNLKENHGIEKQGLRKGRKKKDKRKIRKIRKKNQRIRLVGMHQ